VDANCGGGGAVAGAKTPQAVAFGSRRRSGDPWRAPEMAFSRPRGVDGVWDTVRVDGI